MAVKPTKSGSRARISSSAPALSIVVPLFNEATGLAALHERIAEVARYLQAKRGLEHRGGLCRRRQPRRHQRRSHNRCRPMPLDIQVVTLSRNFGKEAALLAGLDHARLGAVLFMDGDGQHPPSTDRDAGRALARRRLRRGLHGQGASRERALAAPHRRHVRSTRCSIGARATKFPEDAGDFRLLSPRAAAALRQMPERNRFFKGLSSWIGFRQVRVDYEPALRAHGATTWNVWTLIGLSIEGLTSFSVAPLRVASLLGLLLAVTALVLRQLDRAGDLALRQGRARLSFAGGQRDGALAACNSS